MELRSLSALFGLLPLVSDVHEAHLDVLPGECPNRFEVDLEGSGDVAAGVLGNAFDVTNVDLNTIRMNRRPSATGSAADGEFEPIEPSNADFHDVATPLAGDPCDCGFQGTDETLDIVLTFSRAQMIANFDLASEPDGTLIELEVTGLMLDQTPFVARDCIVVRRDSVPERHLDILPGVCPNRFEVDVEGGGDLPAGVLGNAFDVTNVDLNTIRMNRRSGTTGNAADGEFEPIEPSNADFHDAATPHAGDPCDCGFQGTDEVRDIVLTFSRAQMIANFDLASEPDGALIELEVTGRLHDQSPFVARDCIRIVRAQPLSATFCAGDEAPAACPCGNAGLPGRGCDNAQATGGVALSLVTGQLTTDARDALLSGAGFPGDKSPTVVLIRASTRGAGAAFGDGRLCLTGPIQRIATVTAELGAAEVPVHHGAGPGSFHYQLWYRSTPAAYCDPDAGFNLSNGLSIDWPK